MSSATYLLPAHLRTSAYSHAYPASKQVGSGLIAACLLLLLPKAIQTATHSLCFEANDSDLDRGACRTGSTQPRATPLPAHLRQKDRPQLLGDS